MTIFRPTKKPAKRLIYLALLRDSKLSKNKKVGSIWLQKHEEPTFV